ncbi:hypothetical protein M8818_004858 [Zalaria obscura]|uniref:Uncharacterized protein n=1 Tax=Zalaria obscura TaxID=2024903 RepID=A0ACC3SDW8_9PEZI
MARNPSCGAASAAGGLLYATLLRASLRDRFRLLSACRPGSPQITRGPWPGALRIVNGEHTSSPLVYSFPVDSFPGAPCRSLLLSYGAPCVSASLLSFDLSLIKPESRPNKKQKREFSACSFGASSDSCFRSLRDVATASVDSAAPSRWSALSAKWHQRRPLCWPEGATFGAAVSDLPAAPLRASADESR